MLRIEFDRTIDTDLPATELWNVMKEAFEDPASSPVWPVDLEKTRPIELRRGAEVAATYRVGPVAVEAAYHITEFEPGVRFRYESSPSHPLAGGATVEAEPRQQGSQLHWTGRYRARLHPLAPFAYLFVRLYFIETFFRRLEENLRAYENTTPPERTGEPR